MRHARATRAELSLEAENGAVVLRVRDDGRGIDAAGLRSGHGVRGMRERALLVGGDLEVVRVAPHGTEVRLRLPVKDARMSEHPLKIRILLADDHTVVRRGLRMVLEAAPDLEVVAEASDGIEAVERALREDIDLAILDVAMPRRTGLQAARELSRRRPELKLLMLSMHEVEQYFFEAMKAGASGYVLKTAAGRDLVEACRSAMRGEPFLYPPAVRGIIRDYLERAADGDGAARGAADRARARGAQARRRGVHERADRGAADDQPAHGRAPPREPDGQARDARPRAAHPLRDPARAAWSREMGSSAHVPTRGARLASKPRDHELRRSDAMGFLQRFRHDEPQEQTCPRCRMPAPADAERCPECDWDLHEAYHAPEPAPDADRV